MHRVKSFEGTSPVEQSEHISVAHGAGHMASHAPLESEDRVEPSLHVQPVVRLSLEVLSGI